MFSGFAQQRAAMKAAEYNQAKAMREHMMFGRTFPDRATGRTYRKCLEIMLAASSGKKTVFVVGNNSERMAIVEALHNLYPFKSTQRDRLEFPNGGVVHIKHLTSNFTGWRVDLVITDELLGATWRDIEKFQRNIQYVTNGENT